MIMENNSIHPDDMDRLLREHFLDSDLPEKEQITDMMAKHAFNTAWPMVPPAGKGLAFAAKKGFFGSFSMNILIAAVTVTVATGAGIYLYRQNKKASHETSRTAAARHHRMVMPEMPVVTASAETVQPATPAIPPRMYDTPPPVAQTAPADSTTAPKNDTPKNTPPLTTKPRKTRYILVPDLTPEEIAQNNRRKQEMVQQVVRKDKKEWAFIPMGTTAVNAQPVSMNAFYMMAHEVSNLQYRTFLYDLVIHEQLNDYEKAAIYDSAWTRYEGFESLAQTYFWHPKFDNYPVVNVSVEGAELFCKWFTREVNKAMSDRGDAPVNDIRLPRTEEWVRAAKADNDSLTFAWPGQFLRDRRGTFLANCKSSGGPGEYDGADITAPVTAYFVSPWGLYNMCGNVSEITIKTTGNNKAVVLKGGSWSQPAEYMKINSEVPVSEKQAISPTVGFRPVFTFLN